jgi:hypothetical protein
LTAWLPSSGTPERVSPFSGRWWFFAPAALCQVYGAMNKQYRAGCIGGWRWLVTALLLWVAAGCLQYDWQYDFKQAEAQAREQDKNLFIFYKYFLDSKSNRMLGSEVLSDPEVVALFQNTVNVLIDSSFGPEYEAYVDDFGVQSYPASILVAPDGRYETLEGYVPKRRFIEFVESFKRQYGSSEPNDNR